MSKYICYLPHEICVIVLLKLSLNYMNEYVVYQYNSHLRGRLLEYKCELNVKHLQSQISQNMEQWMSYYDALQYES